MMQAALRDPRPSRDRPNVQNRLFFVAESALEAAAWN